MFSFFLFFYLSLFSFFFLSKKLFFSSSILGSHMSSPTISLRVRLVGGVEKWKTKNGERIEKWADRKFLVFSHMCLVERMERYRDRKLEKWNWSKLTIMFLLNKTKGNTIFYTHLFIKKIMYGHFTFFFNYYFKGTG